MDHEAYIRTLQDEADLLREALKSLSPKPAQSHAKYDEVAEAVGQSWLNECQQALLECVTLGDMFDVAAGGLVSHRGFSYIGLHTEPDAVDQHAYDVAFFDVLEATIEGLRRIWGGYHHTLRTDQPPEQEAKTLYLHIHCDVVHPESGEVIAEKDTTLTIGSPFARRALRMVKDYPNWYHTTQDIAGHTHMVGVLPD